MHKNRMILYIIGILLCPHVLFAQESYDISNTFTKYAAELKLKGNFRESIDYFARAFLLDPKNQTAKESLLEFSKDSAINPTLKLNLTLFYDLINQMDNIQGRIDYFSHKKNVLFKDLISEGFNEDDLNSEIDSINKKFHSWTQNLDKTTKAQDMLVKPIEVLNSYLLKEKDKLSLSLDCSEEQYKSLLTKKNIRPSSFDSDAYNLYAKNFYIKYPDFITDKNARFVSVSDNGRVPGQNVTKLEFDALKKELALVYKKLNDFQSLLYGKDSKIKEMSKRMLEFSRELKDKTTSFEKNSKELLSMDDELKDLRSRLELGEKIIQDKTKEIRSLKAGLKETQEKIAARNEEVDDILSSKDKKILEIDGILDIYKGKLTDTNNLFKNKLVQINTLESQIMLVQRKLIEKNHMLKAAMNKIESLQVDLFESEEKLFRYKNKSFSAGAQNDHSSSRDIENKEFQSRLDNFPTFLNNQFIQTGSIDRHTPTNR